VIGLLIPGIDHRIGDKICLRLIVRLTVAVETISELSLEQLILPCGFGMSSQVIAESERSKVCLAAVLDDVDVMRVGNALPKGVAGRVAENGKVGVAQASKPFDVGINRTEVCHGDEDVNDRLGG